MKLKLRGLTDSFEGLRFILHSQDYQTQQPFSRQSPKREKYKTKIIIMSNFVDTLTVEDKVVGYQCNNLVEGSGNTVENEELSFWFDVKFPEGGDGESEAIELVRSQLLESVADEFGVSDGFRCENPPLDGSVWAVRFTSNTNQFVKEDFFGKSTSSESCQCFRCCCFRFFRECLQVSM